MTPKELAESISKEIYDGQIIDEVVAIIEKRIQPLYDRI